MSSTSFGRYRLPFLWHSDRLLITNRLVSVAGLG
jgi:hypothetical protein